MLSLNISNQWSVQQSPARVCDEDVSAASLLGDGIVQGVPLFQLRMPLGDFLSDRELEYYISYEKPVLSTYAKKVKPIVIAILMDPISNHWTPCCSVIPHSGIEVAEDDQFVPWYNGGDEVI